MSSPAVNFFQTRPAIHYRNVDYTTSRPSRPTGCCTGGRSQSIFLDPRYCKPVVQPTKTVAGKVIEVAGKVLGLAATVAMAPVDIAVGVVKGAVKGAVKGWEIGNKIVPVVGGVVGAVVGTAVGAVVGGVKAVVTVAKKVATAAKKVWKSIFG